jgi:DNA-3-methyladenine glycosylase II
MGEFHMNMIFQYGETETEYLKKRDKALGEAIEVIGPIQRAIQPDLFTSLIKSIIGQQISSKAQVTIWGRLITGINEISGTGDVTPENILSLSEAQLQSYGMSFRKASYIRGAAQHVADGKPDLEALREKSDDEVCRELVQINGVGVWTAEMLMLFSMQRPNILSFGDLAIVRGMRMLYKHKEITKERFEKYRKRYTPYGSVASLYLWEIAGGAVFTDM